MKLACPCGETQETPTIPETWVVSQFKLGMSEEPETGENPLGHGVVRAFCSQECEQNAKDENFQRIFEARK
ncbi:MAG: hypothetical protein ACYSW0_16055 [Planctomycetota bacterium]|jgi:hypothetical protein